MSNNVLVADALANFASAFRQATTEIIRKEIAAKYCKFFDEQKQHLTEALDPIDTLPDLYMPTNYLAWLESLAIPKEGTVLGEIVSKLGSYTLVTKFIANGDTITDRSGVFINQELIIETRAGDNIALRLHDNVFSPEILRQLAKEISEQRSLVAVKYNEISN